MATEVLKILIVNNDEDELNILAQNLKGKFPDTDIKLASDGRQALHLIVGHRPDLLVTHLQMPGLNGFALIRRLRRALKTKDIAIVATSSTADIGTVKLALSTGVDDFLLAPVDFEVLFKRIRQVVENRKEGLTLREGFRSYFRRDIEGPVEILLKVTNVSPEAFQIIFPCLTDPVAPVRMDLLALCQMLGVKPQSAVVRCQVVQVKERSTASLLGLFPIDPIEGFEEGLHKYGDRPHVIQKKLSNPNRPVLIAACSQTTDISGGGMALSFPWKIQPETSIQVSLAPVLKQMGIRSEDTQVNCIVRRVKEEENLFQHGLQFVKADSFLLKQVMKWCVSESIVPHETAL